MAQMDERYGQAVQANRGLSGSALSRIATQVSRTALELGAVLRSVDAYGERIIGAALAKGDAQVVDPWSRMDGIVVLLVSGAVAGPVGISETALRARSMGAVAVHAAIVDGYPEPIVGCDTITSLPAGHHAPRRLKGHHSAA
ncbi:hypothetical protein [Pedococcus bigeumensis]|uniref:Uncharacterized protein n=1 Tax=Pedococcus bigeumensis TaxID=433644 RepID=A0A502CWZ0_9MICO|nr:hypothetical protein [Pedococcus bigeumensis]TPG17162.1 hypothetical protein EAH86_10390 [Pedococcus bigeumensis]